MGSRSWGNSAPLPHSGETPPAELPQSWGPSTGAVGPHLLLLQPLAQADLGPQPQHLQHPYHRELDGRGSSLRHWSLNSMRLVQGATSTAAAAARTSRAAVLTYTLLGAVLSTSSCSTLLDLSLTPAPFLDRGFSAGVGQKQHSQLQLRQALSLFSA